MISKEEWNEVKRKKYDEPEELERDGFIHFVLKNDLSGLLIQFIKILMKLTLIILPF